MDSVAPPAPPPRPSHTLESTRSHSVTAPLVHADYDKASSSPTPTSPRPTERKKLSWKKPPSFHVNVPASTASDLHSYACVYVLVNATVLLLLLYSWFQGKLSRERAEERLKEVDFDCFLIRESESRVGEYALSLHHDSIIKHFRIDTKRGVNLRYELYGARRSFSSLDVLVDYYSHHCISTGGELLTTAFSTEVRYTWSGRSF